MGRSIALTVYMLFARFGKGKFTRRPVNAIEAHKSSNRPVGNLVCIHAASVGGAQAVLSLSKHLLGQNPELYCLITSREDTVAQVITDQLSDRILHTAAPSEATKDIYAFLDAWRPDLSVCTEDLVPSALVVQTAHRGIPQVFVNARVASSATRLFKRMSGAIYQKFDHILAQDSESHSRLTDAGVAPENIEISGPLKETATPLTYDENQRKAFARAIGGRSVWLAALTHEGEEEVIVTAHREARKSCPELLLILVPHDPARGDAIEAILDKHECTVARRSSGQTLERQTDVYLADTRGEMGLWYRLAPVSFVGGSFSSFGAHNPLNAAALGSAILHGPNVTNFTTSYDNLADAGGCVGVADGVDLARRLEEILAPERAAELATAAWAASSEGAEVTDSIVALIQSYFTQEAN